MAYGEAETPATDVDPNASEGEYSDNLYFLSKGFKNWAVDAGVRARVVKEIVPMVKYIKGRRVTLTQYWHSLFRLWSMEHEVQGYIGRSNIYVPASRKIIDRLTYEMTKQLFPSDDSMAVTPLETEWKDMAPDVRALIAKRFKEAAIRSLAEPVCRQLIIAGITVGKVMWFERKVKAFKKKSVKTAEGLFASKGYQQQDIKIHCGPILDLIHPGNFFVWPENRVNMADVYVAFDTSTRTKNELLNAAGDKEDSIYVKSELEKIKGNQTDDNKQYNEAQTLRGQGMSPPNDEAGSREDHSAVGGLIDCDEVWIDWDPRELKEGEVPQPVPMKMYITTGGQVLQVAENPLADKRPPYVVARIGKVIGRFYGTGVGEPLQQYQQLMNDQTNQTQDAATYMLNNIALFNPDLVIGGLPDIEPGISIPVQDVERAIRFITPPQDMVGSGNALRAGTAAEMQDYGFSPPVLTGGSAPGRAFRTASGVQSATTNAVVPLTEIVRSFEEDFMEPLMQKFFCLDQQFGEDEQLVELSGPDGATVMRRLKPSQLAGDYQFKWMASTKAQSLTVLGAQIDKLFATLRDPMVQKLLAQNGKRFNPVPLLQKLYTEVMSFRDFEHVFPPAQGMPPPDPEPSAPLLQEDQGGYGSPSPESFNGPMPGMEDDPAFSQVREEANQQAGNDPLAQLLGSVQQPE
jgi:hypothetical protein